MWSENAVHIASLSHYTFNCIFKMFNNKIYNYVYQVCGTVNKAAPWAPITHWHCPIQNTCRWYLYSVQMIYHLCYDFDTDVKIACSCGFMIIYISVKTSYNGSVNAYLL